MTKSPIKLAWQLSIPVLIAYFSLGMVFGALALKAGCPSYIAVLMSALIYAGAGQFVMLSILSAGGSLITILISCLFVLLRNSFYGLNLLERFNFSKLNKLYLIFGLVDTNYAILVTTPPYKDKQQDRRFCTWLSTFIYSSWVLGTLAGVILASHLHIDLSALEFVLVAFFVVMLFEQFLKTKNLQPILIASVSFLIMLGLLPNHLLIGSIITSCIIYLGLFYWREYNA